MVNYFFKYRKHTAKSINIKEKVKHTFKSKRDSDKDTISMDYCTLCTYVFGWYYFSTVHVNSY